MKQPQSLWLITISMKEEKLGKTMAKILAYLNLRDSLHNLRACLSAHIQLINNSKNLLGSRLGGFKLIQLLRNKFMRGNIFKFCHQQCKE